MICPAQLLHVPYSPSVLDVFELSTRHIQRGLPHSLGPASGAQRTEYMVTGCKVKAIDPDYTAKAIGPLELHFTEKESFTEIAYGTESN